MNLACVHSISLTAAFLISFLWETLKSPSIDRAAVGRYEKKRQVRSKRCPRVLFGAVTSEKSLDKNEVIADVTTLFRIALIDCFYDAFSILQLFFTPYDFTLRVRSHGMRNCGYVKRSWLVVASFRQFRCFLRKFISFADPSMPACVRVCTYKIL